MRRHFLFSCFLILLSSFVSAQTSSKPTTLDGWAERLGAFGKSIPQEQVFVHMDNTCYFLGDTIYYKAYVRRSDTGTPSRLSGVLYAELLNQDGYLVERQQLELRNGQVHGSFVLQDTLYGGYYELRAYTRWQLNWGITEHPHNKVSEQWFFNKRMAKEYYQDYEKLYSRVFPVFDKPKEPGDFFHEMTLRPLRRLSKIDETSPKPRLQLFPEGGNIVAGVPNRVAFEATSNEGLHLDGKVTVTEGSGTVVAEADVEQRGRGSFTFTPQSGKTYTATYVGKKGTTKEKLPSPDVDGVALQVVNNGVGNRQIEVKAAGSAASEELGMTVMHDGVMLDFQTIPAGSSATLVLDESKLKTGVCQVTIYNNVGRVYADRLFFCRKDDFAPSNLRFNGLGKQPLEPFAPANVAVEGGKPGATVSVSVCDATHSEYLYDNGNILTEMLLASEIRGFVENPGYFFEADDEEHNRALDLLLMIQGWRRYDWHTMTEPGAFVLNHKPEQTPLLVGEVNKYMASEQESQFADNFISVSAGSNAADAVSLTVSLPAAQHTGTTLRNLVNLIYTRASLLNKALGTSFRVDEGLTDALLDDSAILTAEAFRKAVAAYEDEHGKALDGLTITPETITFASLPETDDPAVIRTFTELCALMNKQALTQKRIQAKEVNEENEKYSMRIWLIRLGLNGPDHKETRKVLMENLTGHCAFRTDAEKVRWQERQAAKREALKAAKASTATETNEDTGEGVEA